MPEDVASILEDSDWINNLEQMSNKDILRKCQDFVGRRRYASETSPVPNAIHHRGEVHPRLPRVHEGSSERPKGLAEGGRPTSYYAISPIDLPPPKFPPPSRESPDSESPRSRG